MPHRSSEASPAARSRASNATSTCRREVEEGALAGVREALPAPGETGEASADAARGALQVAVVAACSMPRADALELQSRRSAAFMTRKARRAGVVGSATTRAA